MFYGKFEKKYKDVPETVINTSKMVSNGLCTDSAIMDNLYLSRINTIPYITGKFTSNVDKKYGIDSIDVEYTLYVVDDLKGYGELCREGDISLSSSFDHTKGSINIVSAVIGGYLSPDFNDIVVRQVNGLYRYVNKTRDSVSDDSVKLIKYGKTKTEIAIGMLVYMSFEHRIVSYAKEFYRHLITNKPKNNFEGCLRYSMFRDYSISIAYLNHEVYSRNREKYLEGFGIGWADFEDSVKCIADEFKRKLYNAYQKYDYGKTDMVVNRLKRKKRIKEKSPEERKLDEYRLRYGDNIELGIESFYEF